MAHVSQSRSRVRHFAGVRSFTVQNGGEYFNAAAAGWTSCRGGPVSGCSLRPTTSASKALLLRLEHSSHALPRPPCLTNVERTQGAQWSVAGSAHRLQWPRASCCSERCQQQTGAAAAPTGGSQRWVHGSGWQQSTWFACVVHAICGCLAVGEMDRIPRRERSENDVRRAIL